MKQAKNKQKNQKGNKGLLKDISSFCKKIENFVAGIDEKTFLSGALEEKRLACSFVLLHIGESAKSLSDNFKNNNKGMTSLTWDDLSDTRNILAHQYGVVKPTALYNICTIEIPKLRQYTNQILQQMSQQQQQKQQQKQKQPPTQPLQQTNPQPASPPKTNPQSTSNNIVVVMPHGKDKSGNEVPIVQIINEEPAQEITKAVIESYNKEVALQKQAQEKQNQKSQNKGKSTPKKSPNQNKDL